MNAGSVHHSPPPQQAACSLTAEWPAYLQVMLPSPSRRNNAMPPHRHHDMIWKWLHQWPIVLPPHQKSGILSPWRRWVRCGCAAGGSRRGMTRRPHRREEDGACAGSAAAGARAADSISRCRGSCSHRPWAPFFGHCSCSH